MKHIAFIIVATIVGVAVAGIGAVVGTLLHAPAFWLAGVVIVSCCASAFTGYVIASETHGKEK